MDHLCAEQYFLDLIIIRILNAGLLLLVMKYFYIVELMFLLQQAQQNEAEKHQQILLNQIDSGSRKGDGEAQQTLR